MTENVATSASPTLVALAEAAGVAATYWSFFGDRVEVPAETLVAILAAMGIEASTEADAQAALTRIDEQPWLRLLPPTVVARQGGGEATLHVRDGHDVSLEVSLEDGEIRSLAIGAQQPSSREIDGGRVWRLTVPLPADLPLGWHTLRARQFRHSGTQAERLARGDRVEEATLVVTPDRLPDPPVRARNAGRGWGYMAQLYSVRSRASWGMGDFSDLADLAAITGWQGADFLLVNPVHAAEVTSPIEPSPYLPSTRRFLAPLYVRPENIREAAYLPERQRSAVARAHAEASVRNTDANRIDRDAAWASKRTALEQIFEAPRSPAREGEFQAFVAREGQALTDFALWCALEEHYAETLTGDQRKIAGGRDGRPEEARDIRSPLVARLRVELADRVLFHEWLQWIADEQMRSAQAAASTAGMRIGIMHDLAVGVHEDGADVWSMSHMYAREITVGAPPDMYNQLGQDWSQPPWLPAALADAGYRPLRDMIRTLLRGAGALRIDHVIGLFRLWWIPQGLRAAAGTYVRYDHEAMIGVLLLEAHRAGAVLIGEDLGTVEDWVRDYLAARGVLGTSVLWFEYEGEGPMPPERYRPGVLATVNTHDLPPTAGYLAGVHVDVRHELGLLTQPIEEVRAAAIAERDRMLAILRQRGLIAADAAEEEIVRALHVLLAAAPSRLFGVALVDAVGERRVQNQPGTFREYPNWEIPLGDASGEVVLLDDLASTRRFVALSTAMREALGG